MKMFSARYAYPMYGHSSLAFMHLENDPIGIDKGQNQGISPSEISLTGSLRGGDFLLRSRLGRIGSGVQQRENCYSGL
jgi:hypothetical protein